MTECTDRGCQNLEWKCGDCGRVASTATFGWEHKGLLSISENSTGKIEYLPNAYEWISVEDRLPTDMEHVLVFDKTEGVCRGYIWGRSWSHYPIGSYASDGCLYHVTHWMPLPNSPEGK